MDTWAECIAALAAKDARIMELKIYNAEQNYLINDYAVRYREMARKIAELECQKNALQEVNEGIETDICRMREAIRRNVVDAPDLQATNMNEAHLAALELQRRKEALIAALASTGPCPFESRLALLEKVAEWADKLEISMHRVDRDGNPQYDAWALSSFRAALDAAKEG